jgi:hypothetical protein
MSNPTVIPDSDIRAIFNSYPDPVSQLIVNKETGLGASAAANLIEGVVTFGDKDYSETILVMDLPDAMALGTATISVTDEFGAPIINPYNGNSLPITPASVEIIATTGGMRDNFANQEGLTVFANYLKAQERAPHYVVSFQGTTVPHAIQLDLSHDPDIDNGGVGRAYVVNQRGDLKSINWYDDGIGNLRVIILPSKSATLADMVNLKFYVAGGIANLAVVPASMQAFDINGNTVPGVTAHVN